MNLQEIILYPVKSLRGVSVESWVIEKRGLRHDRRWMLVDEDGLFLTQRKLHRMALIAIAPAGNGWRVSLGESFFEFSFEPGEEMLRAQVWNSVVDALSVSNEADRWFSSTLGVACRLVYMPDSTKRHVPSAEAKSGDLVGFADSNPILVASQASIDDLNSRLPNPIPIRRFRPNLVVSGASAYEEDEWSGFDCGEAKLRKTKGCGRCLVTTIDIDTAQPSDEPLRTLATYRKRGNNVYFGTYYAPDALGRIGVGMEVHAHSAASS